MADFSTLNQLLSTRAEQCPDRLAYSFHHYPGDTVERIDYATLDWRARVIAKRLLDAGLQDATVGLLFNPGLRFIEAFFGCLYAGAIAVPLAATVRDKSSKVLINVLNDAQVGAVLCDSQLCNYSQKLIDQLPSIERRSAIVVNLQLYLDEPPLQQTLQNARGLALLQYTSGSTGTPKGVMISQQNILHNESLIKAAFEHTDESVVVGWLPMFHDMGLIGNVLQPLYVGCLSVLFSPMAFVQSPVRWLRLISQYKANTSGGPNFGFQMCVDRVKNSELAALDLSSWTLAFIGAEPVRASTMQRFTQKFKRCGFALRAFYPCYGLAEATLFVSGGAKGSEPHALRLSAETLAEGTAVSCCDDSSQPVEAIESVSCGCPGEGSQVLIVDAETRSPCDENSVGEIWIDNASKAQGYWNNHELSCSSFAAFLSTDTKLTRSYFRTGDMGFIRDGELYVTGRMKDQIIIRGKNHFPQDIEITVETHAQIGNDCCAAIEVERDEQQQLVLLIELRKSAFHLCGELRLDLTAAVTAQHGISPRSIVFVPRNTLSRGTSGKLQRFQCKRRYLAQQIETVESVSLVS